MYQWKSQKPKSRVIASYTFSVVKYYFLPSGFIIFWKDYSVQTESQGKYIDIFDFCIFSRYFSEGVRQEFKVHLGFKAKTINVLSGSLLSLIHRDHAP